MAVVKWASTDLGWGGGGRVVPVADAFCSPLGVGQHPKTAPRRHTALPASLFLLLKGCTMAILRPLLLAAGRAGAAGASARARLAKFERVPCAVPLVRERFLKTNKKSRPFSGSCVAHLSWRCLLFVFPFGGGQKETHQTFSPDWAREGKPRRNTQQCRLSHSLTRQSRSVCGGEPGGNFDFCSRSQKNAAPAR